MVHFLLHSYGQFDRRHPLRPTIWPHFDILFVHTGRLLVECGKENPVLLRKNEGLLIFPHTLFRGKSVTDTVRASVQHFALENVEGEPTEPVFSRLEGRSKEAWPFSTAGHPPLLHDIERALNLAAKPATPAIRALRLAQLQLIVGEITAGRSQSRRKSSLLPPALTEVLDWAANHPGEASIVALANRSGYSFSHFRALFEKHLGSTPGRYFRELKINEAKRLLRETRLPLKQIAAGLGFADAVSFHRSFTSLTQSTPDLYRRRNAPRG